MGKSAVTVYEFRSRFRAPLPFVFRWCTDYSPVDPKLEGEEYVRRIIRRTRRRVVYEDLDDQAEGWLWSRMTVDLLPPNRWHAEADGNYRTWSIDYRLVPLSDESTELRFRGVRRATSLGGRNPSKVGLERSLRSMWKRYASALERDYRAGRKT